MNSESVVCDIRFSDPASCYPFRSVRFYVRGFGIYLIHKGFRVIYERYFRSPAEFVPIRTVGILYRIYPRGRHFRVKMPESIYLVLPLVATIVQDYLGDAVFVQNSLQEIFVALVAYSDRNISRVESGARRVYVDTHDLRQGAEIFLPHLQRAAVVHPDLQKDERFVGEGGKIFFVNWQIPRPFAHFVSLVFAELSPEAHGVILTPFGLRVNRVNIKMLFDRTYGEILESLGGKTIFDYLLHPLEGKNLEIAQKISGLKNDPRLVYRGVSGAEYRELEKEKKVVSKGRGNTRKGFVGSYVSDDIQLAGRFALRSYMDGKGGYILSIRKDRLPDLAPADDGNYRTSFVPLDAVEGFFELR